jgi:serine/threonine-protein kinase CTR1
VEFGLFERGVYSSEEHELVPRWKEVSDYVKMNSGSVVFPIGELSVGFCRHRSLLFKASPFIVLMIC